MIPKRVTNLIICFHGLLVHCTTLITLWVGWIFCIRVGEHRFITVNFIPSPLVNKLIKAKSEIWSNQINLCTYLCTCRSPIRNVTSDVRAALQSNSLSMRSGYKIGGKNSSSTWVGCSTSCLGTGKVICPSAHVHTSNNVKDLKILQWCCYLLLSIGCKGRLVTCFLKNTQFVWF